jgi:hypothetical protein
MGRVEWQTALVEAGRSTSCRTCGCRPEVDKPLSDHNRNVVLNEVLDEVLNGVG